ncbi:MAG: Nramp family divalent metal transporter [Candidatus Woesearchaeota archaeon]|nr:Nramp family divalent metal transporter [Candidatus Woesearchaeota archaeon]
MGSLKLVINSKLKELMIFFSIMGPGLITAFADNDAGGIATYSVAGATLGYGILWVVIPITLVLIFVQEMNARMGVITGKGLSDLIRENYGVKITLFVMVALFVANIATTISNFAGIAAAAEIFGIQRIIAIPICAFVIWMIITKGNYKSTEKIFFILAFFYITYIIAGFMAKPDWGLALSSTLKPTLQFDKEYLLLLIGLIGTTVTPWMQFYMQAAFVEKGIRAENYKYSKADVYISSVITDIVTYFVILTCAATLFVAGIRITTAKEAALALAPLAGQYASTLFAIGLFVASFFAAIILPISTAFCICEGIGFEAGVNKNFKDAPQFYWILTLIIGIAAFVSIMPRLPLIKVMLTSQVISGIILPIILIIMLNLINKKELMGEHVNSKFYNIIVWAAAIIIIILTLILVFVSVFGNILKI